MFEKGQQIGPYTLVKPLGEGSFGVVWLAEQRTELVTLQVAAKLPKAQDIDMNEFRKEAEDWVAAGVHPNVLPLITADIFAGQVVFASQFAPGGTLSDWLAKHGVRAPTIEAAVQMVTGILKGLKHIHSKDIVHGDLKPANVLLQESEENPQIADFGLARVLRRDLSTLTLTPEGSPAYMAPEVWKGNDRCFQADLWAVGVVFYEMLAGDRPFNGRTPDQVSRAVREDSPPALPASVSQAIQLIVEKALQGASKGQGEAVSVR
jgi:serine/threonine protein kinase